jgi:hypothetical protein
MTDTPTRMSSLSPVATLVDAATPQLANWHRYVLLVLFCFAQFLDAFSNAAIFSALPRLKEKMDMNESESTWVVAAFQLTFASFLLVSGRFSDIYNPSTSSHACGIGRPTHISLPASRVCAHLRPRRSCRLLSRHWLPQQQDSAHCPPCPQRHLYVPFILCSECNFHVA